MNWIILAACIIGLLGFCSLIAHFYPSHVENASKKAAHKLCESMGVAGDCSQPINEILSVNVSKFGRPAIPGLKPSDRKTWIDAKDWELNSYSQAYQSIRGSNFGDVDADLTNLKSQAVGSEVSEKFATLSVKEQLNKLKDYVGAKGALSGLSEHPTEFMNAFDGHKKSYSECRSKIEKTDKEIRELLTQKDAQANFDPTQLRAKISELGRDISELVGQREPLEEDLRVAKQRIETAVLLQEELSKETSKYDAAQIEFSQIEATIRDTDSDIATANGQMNKVQSEIDSNRKKNEAIDNKIQALKTKRDNLVKSMGILNTLLKENEELLIQMKSIGKCEYDPTETLLLKLNITNSELRAQVMEYKKKISEVAQEASDFITQKLGIPELRSKISNLEKELKEVNEEIYRIESQPGSVAALLKALDTQIQEQKSLITELTNNRAKLVEQQSGPESIIMSITQIRKSRGSQTGPNVEELRASHDRIQANIEANSNSRESRLAKLRAEQKLTQDSLDNYESGNSALNRRLNELIQRLNEEMTGCKPVESVLREFINTAQVWIESLDKSRRRVEELKQELEAAIKDV